FGGRVFVEFVDGTTEVLPGAESIDEFDVEHFGSSLFSHVQDAGGSRGLSVSWCAHVIDRTCIALRLNVTDKKHFPGRPTSAGAKRIRGTASFQKRPQLFSSARD